MITTNIVVINYLQGRNEPNLKTGKTETMTKQESIAKIARDILWIETLEERKNDSLDFHELAVWQVEKALSAAYEAGKNSK